MSYQSIRCDVAAPGVAWIELTRAADQNPLDVELCVELVAALGFVQSSPELRAVVLTHKGPFFCSGGELRGEVDPSRPEKVGPVSEVLKALHGLGKPSICAIDGRVQGAGNALVLACDVATASLASSFLVPEGRIGLWSFHLLPDLVRAVGRRRATLLLLEGGAIAAGEAAGIGLITRVSSGDVREEALAMATRYAAYSPTAMRLGLTALRRAENSEYDASLAWLQDRCDELLAAPDTIEADRAFRERRAPEWGKKS